MVVVGVARRGRVRPAGDGIGQHPGQRPCTLPGRRHSPGGPRLTAVLRAAQACTERCLWLFIRIPAGGRHLLGVRRATRHPSAPPNVPAASSTRSGVRRSGKASVWSQARDPASRTVSTSGILAGQPPMSVYIPQVCVPVPDIADECLSACGWSTRPVSAAVLDARRAWPGAEMPATPWVTGREMSRSGLLTRAHGGGGLLDEVRDRGRLGDVDGVAARDLDDVRPGP